VRPALLLGMLVLAGCGGAPAQAPGTAPPRDASAAPPPASAPTVSAPALAPRPALRPARCTSSAGANCTAHTGRVLTIESVDPDGDGDLHVVATGGSLTAPGITVFDVSRSLRPARDPRPGDRVTGAGPVYRGHLNQRQIQVTSFRVARVAR